MLALLFVLLGAVLHFVVESNLLRAADQELAARASHLQHMPPAPPRNGGPGFGGMPGGPPGPGFDGMMGSPPGGPPRFGGMPGAPPGGQPGFALRRPEGRRFHRPGPGGPAGGMPHFFDVYGNPLPFNPPSPLLSKPLLQRALHGEAYGTVQQGSSIVRVLMGTLKGGGGTVVYQFSVSLAGMQHTLENVDRALLTLFPFAVLLSALGGAALTGSALQPVRQISRSLQHMSADHLSERLPAAGADEFAQLAATCNGMLERLEGAFAEREALVKQLQELVELQKRFTADASHELKTPLTVIKANTSLLLEETGLSEETREAVADMDGAADQMRKLVQDLLLLALLDSGVRPLHVELVAVRDLLEHCIKSTARPHSPAVSLVIEPENLAAAGNAEQLARLVTNLLDNALRYTPEQGKVAVRARQQTVRMLLLEVEDTGEGIAAVHLPHLGERFYRADASRTRAQGGTGLGLAICREIVLAHQGSIEWMSQIGKGTLVRVQLPLYETIPPCR